MTPKNKLLKGACIILLLNIATSSNIFGSTQEFKAQGKPVIAKVSTGKQNRIEISKSPIIEVIGNAAQYRIIANPNADYFYLVPQVRSGSKIDLSIIHGDSKAIELTLDVGAGDSEAIRIFDNDEAAGNLKSTKPQEFAREIADMMRHMVLGKKGKYHIEKVSKIITTPKTSDTALSYTIRYNYANAGLIGRKVSVINRGNRQISVKPKDFEHLFENVIAVSTDRELLSKGENGNLYLISKVDEWNKE